MNKDNAKKCDSASAINDPLTDLLRTGARALIQPAVEAELQTFLGGYAKVTDLQGRQAVVRNGYLPEREIVTGVGNVTVKISKVRDRSGSGIKFNSALVPPYVRKPQRVEAALPWLYLRGVSTGDMQSALPVLLGDDAKGLSATVVSRLKAQWAEDYLAWNRRDLAKERYVYVWADGIYSTLRGKEICMAKTTVQAYKAFDSFLGHFEAKYPKAVAVLEKDRESLLVFYDFPAEHWIHIRTTNPIESTFATIRHRTTRTKNCVSRNTLLGLVFQLTLAAEKRWHRIRGFKRLPDVIKGGPFSGWHC